MGQRYLRDSEVPVMPAALSSRIDSQAVFRPAVVVTHALGVPPAGRDAVMFALAVLAFLEVIVSGLAASDFTSLSGSQVLRVWDVGKASTVVGLAALLGLRLRSSGPVLMGAATALAAVAHRLDPGVAPSDWLVGRVDISEVGRALGLSASQASQVLVISAIALAMWSAGVALAGSLVLLRRPRWILFASIVLLIELLILQPTVVETEGPFQLMNVGYRGVVALVIAYLSGLLVAALRSPPMPQR